MRFNPLVAAVVGLLVIAAIPALVHRADQGRSTPYKTGQSHQVASSPQPSVSPPNSYDNHAGADLSAPEKPSYSADNAPDDSLTTTNWLQALSGVAVALFTYFLWRLQARQVGLTESALDETGKSAKAALDTANHAARAAQAAVDQHRAWLKICDLSVTRLRFGKTEVGPQEEYIYGEVTIHLQNVGGTPATDVVWSPAIWVLPFIENRFEQWSAVWSGEIEACAARLDERGMGDNYGFVLWPKDEPQTLTHGVNTQTWPVRGGLKIDSSDKQAIRLMGVATVFYRITSGERVRTAVPFLINVGQGVLKFSYLRDNPELTGNQIGVMLLAGAERAS